MKMTCRPSRLAILLGLGILTCSPLARAAEVSIQLDNPPSTGTVAFALFDSPNAFGDLRDAVHVVKFAMDGRDTYLLKDVPPGDYALLVYFDENGNDRIDRNFIGIPSEPLGFSNRYRPKGPPSYSRAAFLLREEEVTHFDVELYRPLGERGRLGVGLGIIARSSPYRDYRGGVSQVIPTLSYNGKRVQIFGPSAALSLVGRGKLRLAATATYRIGVYNEEDSDYLSGMGDREDTVMAGLAVQAQLPGGVDLSASYAHDALDAIGGGAARLDLSKGLHWRMLRFSPRASVNWLSSELSNHDYGVPANMATAERPVYTLDDTLSVEAGMGMMVEVSRGWLMVISASAEFFNSDVIDSPIVSEDYVIKGFGAISYQF